MYSAVLAQRNFKVLMQVCCLFVLGVVFCIYIQISIFHTLTCMVQVHLGFNLEEPGSLQLKSQCKRDLLNFIMSSEYSLVFFSYH